ncbi:unnamed protein product [Diplocarpon coronariae]
MLGCKRLGARNPELRIQADVDEVSWDQDAGQEMLDLILRRISRSPTFSYTAPDYLGLRASESSGNVDGSTSRHWWERNNPITSSSSSPESGYQYECDYSPTTSTEAASPVMASEQEECWLVVERRVQPGVSRRQVPRALFVSADLGPNAGSTARKSSQFGRWKPGMRGLDWSEDGRACLSPRMDSTRFLPHPHWNGNRTMSMFSSSVKSVRSASVPAGWRQGERASVGLWILLSLTRGLEPATTTPADAREDGRFEMGDVSGEANRSVVDTVVRRRCRHRAGTVDRGLGTDRLPPGAPVLAGTSKIPRGRRLHRDDEESRVINRQSGDGGPARMLLRRRLEEAEAWIREETETSAMTIPGTTRAEEEWKWDVAGLASASDVARVGCQKVSSLTLGSSCFEHCANPLRSTLAIDGMRVQSLHDTADLWTGLPWRRPPQPMVACRALPVSGIQGPGRSGPAQGSIRAGDTTSAPSEV